MDHKEAFAELQPGDGLRRREFLRLLGAGFAAAGAAGCKLRPPQQKIVPHVDQPEEAVPGASLWYATTCGACPAACGALAKVRDGRPIKLEGRPEHPLSRGGLCARGQASILDLYDSDRLRGPRLGSAAAGWDAADGAARSALERARRKGGRVRVLSRTLHSPSLREAVSTFLEGFRDARHVQSDPVSYASIAEAHRLSHGLAAVPHYRFDKAKVIASFDADFLGTWLSPVEFSRDWSRFRRPDADGSMSWHVQFEARMSPTGANADLRAPLAPSARLAALLELGRLVADRRGWRGPRPPKAAYDGPAAAALERTADALAEAAGRSVVLSGSDDAREQLAVNWLNAMLGNYGGTLDLSAPSRQGLGSDAAASVLLAELESGSVEVLVVLDANPAYDHGEAGRFRAAIGKAGFSVSLSGRLDETAALCGAVCPGHHFLESWGDAEPVEGVFSLLQPVVRPLFDTRSAAESLLRWAGRPEGAHDLVRRVWKARVFPRQSEHKDFEAFWTHALREGSAAAARGAKASTPFDPGSVARIGAARPAAPAGAFELDAFASIALFDGRQSNNPWLQELPDPVSKADWGNHASFSPADARRLGLVEGRRVRLSDGRDAVELPAHVQPGQADGVVTSALGYGRPRGGAISANEPIAKLFPLEREGLEGGDVYPLRGRSVRVETLDRLTPLSKTQRADSLVEPFTGRERDAARETTLEAFRRDPASGNPPPPERTSLWSGHSYHGHKWGLAIDLSACSGCSACVVSCQAENNVPVVGKAEIRKGRDMYWLRLDRYYRGPEESPEVAFQPMLCQHCDNAPCETVCPVLATVHSGEGLNMMVYNRCVGTRYCANNCPYKARRFNWFDYAHDDLVRNLALNPDITVRQRGVMEKCSLCVQRILEAKSAAKDEGRKVRDGEILPACAQSCPSQAIVFGDLNDPESRVSKLARSPRAYSVLAELGVGPSVRYLTRVRNKKVS